MRRHDPSAPLATSQARVADTGLKAMIPFGRPFLDHVLTTLADAGIDRVCLVIGPEHGGVREHYARVTPARLRVDFAVQVEPRGTADAVLAAESFAGDDPFLVINGDNWYPAAAITALRRLGAPGLAAFERDDLSRTSGVDAARVRRYAFLDVDAGGVLRRIVEKPGEDEAARWPAPVLVSMNCWAFDRRIFAACRRIGPSERGELELAAAVNDAIDRGVRFRTVRTTGPVLDLSSRADVSAVAARLAGVEVRL
jgi:dTDP-glucose pyrophosphorylase